MFGMSGNKNICFSVSLEMLEKNLSKWWFRVAVYDVGFVNTRRVWGLESVSRQFGFSIY